MFKSARSWAPDSSDCDDPLDIQPNADSRDWIKRHRFSVTDQELTDCFPFDPYPNQMLFMKELYACASEGRLGLFESPTGTGKTLTVICALVTWLKHVYDRSREPAPDKTAEVNDPDEPDWLRDSSPEPDTNENDDGIPAGKTKAPKVQIIYASRTHSQLSQFLGEFAKVKAAKEFKVVAVASRKILCVNPKVKALNSSWRINDECLQLQSKSTSKKQVLSAGTAKASGGCGFRCKGEPSMDTFMSRVLETPMDIEDLVSQGSRRAVCPYYGARSAVPYADIVVVPYNCLIHKATREALGLRLEGSIVVVDEAHNLLPAIHNSHSVALPLSSLHSTTKLLGTYLDHFQTRLGTAKASTVTSVKNISERLADASPALLESPEATAGLGGNCHRVMLPNAFLLGCRLANVNIPKLLAELNEGNLVFKIAGFADTVVKAVAQGGGPLLTIVEKREASEGATQGGTGKDTPAEGKGRAAAAATFQTFLQFLQELSSADSAGRVLLTKTGGSLQLKYVLLDASTKHAETLQQAHSVILTSGTLAPLDILTQQLYRPADAPRMHEFTCGHIVAPERVLAVGVGCGPGGRRLKLTHGVRDSQAIMDECGQLISNFCRVVPQGVVVFVPSFAYADALRHRWSQSGMDKQLAAKKKVFWELRDAAACDGMLKQYQSHISSSPDAGGLLVCVVGAKLSEGINFGDGFGRCVMVLGLPYPDLRDPELNERLMHADRLGGGGRDGGSRGGGSGGEARLGSAGREMYTNLCMQAVNQCVGRAIRHARDYAAVVLVDVRYTTGDSNGETLRAKLPHWVTRRWRDCPDTFGPAMSALAQFFKQVAQT